MGAAIPNPGFMAADEPGVRMNTRAVCAAAEGCAPWDLVYVFCLACLLPPAIWTRFCSATYFIGILGVINQQIEVKLITYDLSIKLRAM